MTTQDVDRSFVATNYEEVELDNNDDNSLCRYELLEIIVRLAKIKYTEKHICDTIAEATERIIVEHILPNSCERMPWQEFRDERLWTLECDDLLKANKAGIEALYRFTKTGPHSSNPLILNMDDACALIHQAGYSSPAHERIAATAYALSKMTIIDEMEDFEDYHNLKRVEFIEFLARAAEMLFTAHQPLVFKLEWLLSDLLTRFVPNQPFVLPDANEQEESDSDCDDDVVSEIKEEILTEMRDRGDI